MLSKFGFLLSILGIILFFPNCTNPALLSDQVGLAVHLPREEQSFKQNESDLFSRLSGTYYRMYSHKPLIPVGGVNEGRIIVRCHMPCDENLPDETDSVTIDNQAGFNAAFMKKTIRLFRKIHFETCGIHQYEILFSRNVNFAVTDSARNKYMIIPSAGEKAHMVMPPVRSP